VITGASSGIGRATAGELGRRGASVVLAARSEGPLKELAREIEGAGGSAHAVVTDVAEWPQVERLARAAVERYGRIDTWVNNAAVMQYATVEDSRPEEMEQLIRVNLLGQMYGSKAALAVMKRQGGGTIINVSSIEGWVGMPLHAAYSASKHGNKGFSEALRRELQQQDSPIQVCLIMPAGINTPLFDHSRSKLGPKPMPLPPAYPPEAVAEAIAYACEHPRLEIVVGGAGKMFTMLERLNPALIDLALGVGHLGSKGQMSSQPDTPSDNLFGPAPADTYRTHGSFDHVTRSSSLYTRLFELHPAWKVALIGAGVLGGLALALRLRRRAARSSPRIQRAGEIAESGNGWSEPTYLAEARVY
jgi:NAD(P)-dependent dehydrogenase (short-subunit alcohol dehydrogenase family)